MSHSGDEHTTQYSGMFRGIVSLIPSPLTLEQNSRCTPHDSHDAERSVPGEPVTVEASAKIAVERTGQGTLAGDWWGVVNPDMSPDDKACLCFDSDPMDTTMILVGIPTGDLQARRFRRRKLDCQAGRCRTR